VHPDFQTRPPLHMWLGDLSILQAEAFNTSPYGVFPIFNSKDMAENVNNIFLNEIDSISIANMFKEF